MHRSLHFIIPVVAATQIASTSGAADLSLSIEVPKLDVGQYHRPNVASWIENADGEHVTDLAVWYDVEMKNDQGATWLKDLRQWWRKSGRSAKLPIDGVTGPTRPVGHHKVEIPSSKLKLAANPASEYSLVVEAAREVGGRELLRIPFTWDGKQRVEKSISGKSELGTIKLVIQSTKE